MSETIFYREWARYPNRRRGLMIKESILPKIISSPYSSGYVSVFSFTEQDALQIKESKSSRGFERFSVGASKVVIDLDQGLDQLIHAEEILQSLGIGYDLWQSGGKGFHPILDTPLQFHEHLPYSHLQFVKSLGIEGIDEAIYRHGSLISLPGRIHPKTKNPKTFVKRVVGDSVEIKIVEKPKFNFLDKKIHGLGLSEALMLISDLSLTEPPIGGRHVAIWGAAKDLLNTGVSTNTAYELIMSAMKNWENPKSSEEVIRAIDQACRYIQ